MGEVFEPVTGSKEKKKDPDKERMRKEMYDRQKDAHGAFKPGSCAKYDATKMQDQTCCAHPVEALKWGGNESSMYASCGRCGLKTCIMYKKNRAFVTGGEVVDTQEVHLVSLKPGLAMIDTGCRAAVGGKKYHQDLQRCLKALGKTFKARRVLPVRPRRSDTKFTKVAIPSWHPGGEP